MHVAAVRLIQGELKKLGHYSAKIDGDRGPTTHAAVAVALEARAGDLQEGWRGWSEKRMSIAFLQLLCRDEGIDSGTIDGWWGPQTDFAYDALVIKRATGALPDWRDRQPIAANPHGFPDQSHGALTEFYGSHGLPSGRRPMMRRVDCPWRLRIAWNLRQTRSFLWCHEKAADSLAEVLAEVHAHYGAAEIERLGLDLFGGDYNPRKKRGGSTWSTHSWGIAIDWAPDRNRLEWGRDRASLAHPDCEDWWKIWEKHGWTGLGRARNFDWMHVQAAKLG